MPLIKAQVVLPFTSNLPRDVITNSLWFGTPNGMSLSTAGDLITPMLQDFYLGGYGAFGLPGYVSKSTCFVKWYDWADPEPRQPYQTALDLSSLVTNPAIIPTEVACVLSFHGEPESGVPVARQRGRIYIGGLTNNALEQPGVGTPYPVFRSTWITGWRDNANGLRIDTNNADVPWVVYSRATGGLTPWYNVVGGWVDNTPDTQRRRGVEATSRTLWP